MRQYLTLVRANTGPIATRVLSGVLAVGTGAILGIARWLTPSPLGHGTHTQLGLGQCTFLTLTGYPCPMCGMTTTFALFAHFRWISAFLNQPFGTVLFAMTVGCFAISLAELVQPKDRWARLVAVLEPYESTLASLFLVGMGLGWLYKIALFKLLGQG